MKTCLDLLDVRSAVRTDVTPIFADPVAFAQLVDDLVRPISNSVELVAGIDALGFSLGTAIALKLGVGFVPIRKGGKLAAAVHSVECVDYTGRRKSLELRKDAVERGARVLVVDDWVETGAQVRAAIELVERSGGIIAGICAINFDGNEQTTRLRAQYDCYSP
jgi:adenine phosphoribosyltransferase